MNVKCSPQTLANFLLYYDDGGRSFIRNVSKFLVLVKKWRQEIPVSILTMGTGE
jgi:hypothetical protein